MMGTTGGLPDDAQGDLAVAAVQLDHREPQEEQGVDRPGGVFVPGVGRLQPDRADGLTLHVSGG
jgi:hypothetical protein